MKVKKEAIQFYDEYPFFDDEDFRVPPPNLPAPYDTIKAELERLELIKQKRKELKDKFGIDLSN